MTLSGGVSARTGVDRVRAAAWGAASLFGAMAAVQVGAAAGLPVGAYLWGGRHDGVLPDGLRAGSAAAVLVLAGFAVVTLARAGVLRRGVPRSAGLTWAIAALMALNTVANLASEHAVERYLFGTVTLLLALQVAVVARGRRGAPPGG